MPKLISCDPEKCVGCQICEFVCSTTKEKRIDPSYSRIHSVNYEPIGNMALACISCEKPACVTACPRRALHQTEKGTIRVDEEKCNGCGWCISACKFGAVGIHPAKKTVIICDSCDGDPKCVALCPFDEALSYSSLDEIAEKSRKKSVANILQELARKPKERE